MGKGGYKTNAYQPLASEEEKKMKVYKSTLVISNSKGLYETLRDIRTSTYQICGNEENS